MENTIPATEYCLSPLRLDLLRKETMTMGQHMSWENKADIMQKPDITNLWESMMVVKNPDLLFGNGHLL